MQMASSKGYLPGMYIVQFTRDLQTQGRIQDLSEGGGQDFLGTKIFFDLKDSKRVKIND